MTQVTIYDVLNSIKAGTIQITGIYTAEDLDSKESYEAITDYDFMTSSCSFKDENGDEILIEYQAI